MLIQGGRIIRVAQIHPDDLGPGTLAVSAAARAAVRHGAPRRCEAAAVRRDLQRGHVSALIQLPQIRAGAVKGKSVREGLFPSDERGFTHLLSVSLLMAALP